MANELSNLSPRPGARRNRMRVGRGEGSGKGRTAGKGTKGQQSRGAGKVAVGFEGGQTPLHRRLPKRGFTNIHATNYIEVGLNKIADKFEAGSIVDLKALKNAGIVSQKIEKKTSKGLILLPNLRIKILGNGEMNKSLTIIADKFTKGAQKIIEAAGGTCTVIGSKTEAE
jgi:large subunit ribosomal protein L15